MGNPANTNALLCSKSAPDIPKENFTCLTRLDQNRAQAQVTTCYYKYLSSLGVIILFMQNYFRL